MALLSLIPRFSPVSSKGRFRLNPSDETEARDGAAGSHAGFTSRSHLCPTPLAFRLVVPARLSLAWSRVGILGRSQNRMVLGDVQYHTPFDVDTWLRSR